ncbi:MAG: class I SAM-dependent methyltransferase [Acidobacteria bacterium]|nr:class I SAM-dependent methyltransferase [Acidobacteriota bacterium]
MDAGDATIRAYQERMEAYLSAQREPSPAVLAWHDRFVGSLGQGSTVLELGSGPGSDADRLEARGLQVLRSDATPAFAERLRGLGHAVLDLDVRTDPIPSGLDGVFANAVLLHLTRDELQMALLRLHGAIRPGGVLACSFKEGDGEEWHDRKLGLPRRFTYWREAPLRDALTTAGFDAEPIGHVRGDSDDWLQVVARA